jgi:hypothetical protein
MSTQYCSTLLFVATFLPEAIAGCQSPYDHFYHHGDHHGPRIGWGIAFSG